MSERTHDDGGMLYRAPTGLLRRCPLRVVCAEPDHFPLADYLGVGTAVLEVDALDDYGRGWSPPMRWREVKQEIDEDKVRSALRIHPIVGFPPGEFSDAVRAAASAWLASRPVRVKFMRRHSPGDDREAIIPLDRHGDTCSPNECQAADEEGTQYCHHLAVDGNYCRWHARVIGEAVARSPATTPRNAKVDSIRAALGDRLHPSTPISTRGIISTIRGALDGRDDHDTLEVNVGWLRELCDAAERDAASSAKYVPGQICGRLVRAFPFGGKMKMRSCQRAPGHDGACDPTMPAERPA